MSDRRFSIFGLFDEISVQNMSFHTLISLVFTDIEADAVNHVKCPAAVR